jgi:predicted AlkP superfamily phosphohydrolase/phosphomutase
MVTPVAWTSFSTGCTPPTHGIHEFSYLEPTDRSVRPNHAGRVRVPTLWHAVDAAGGDTVSLNLPMTFPQPRVHGLIVAGADAPSLDQAFAQCPDFGREVRATLPDYTNKILWKRRPKTFEEMKTLSIRTQAVFRAQARAALLADARVEWTALMVHFHNLDSLQHRLWPYLDVDETGVREIGWNAEVAACLTALDDAVGMLLDLSAERGAAVVAVSDHGFGPCRKLVNVNGLLCQAGLQRSLRYGTRFQYRFSRMRARLNRWRSRHEPRTTSKVAPRSVEGQVGCDWKRTAAYAPFGQLSGCIFLNRAIVATQGAADRATSEVIDFMRESRDPETGRPLFRDVFSTADRYDLEPEQQGIPDVLALSADGYQAQAKWSASARHEVLRLDANLPATHWREGVFAIDAPGIRPGNRYAAELHDIAPTTLALLGLDIPRSMEGRVIQEVFEESLPIRVGEPAEFRQNDASPREVVPLGADCA